MEEDTEYKKLSVEDRCVHKLWKARVDGYEEAARIFREIVDEKSPEWNKFLGLIKKFVADSHAMAQEKGLEATLLFIENCAIAGKTVGEVMSNIVQKCIAAPKTKTKELAVQVTLMCIEIEKHESVVEELIKGMEHKNPKIVAACISAATLALKEFGNKVIGVKLLIKKLAPLMIDRDKAVRDEGKQLAIEIYRWIGAAMKPQIASLPAITITELESEFDKLKGEKAEPTRYLRSQQERQKVVVATFVDDGDAGDDEEEGAAEDIDPMDHIVPVDILSKLPKDFYEKLEAKKWQERKESLEALEKLLENPKLENGDYGDIVRALKKVLTKDTNVLLVAQAGKCMAALAKGLGKRYQPYAGACIPAILEKFKEKKPNVVTALRDAIEAIYPSTSLESIQEDIVEALNNKNPSVKAETTAFLAKAFARTQPTVLNKKLLKALITALLKTLNESDPTVRDNSAEALGILIKLMGEKIINPFLIDVDALKMVKIKECQEKAVILVKTAGAKKDRPATAPVKVPAAASKGGSTEPRPVTRPATAGGIKKPMARKASAGGSSGGIAKSASSLKVVNIEKELSSEEVEARAAEILTADILSGLGDANWKTRLVAVESFLSFVLDLDPKCGLAQILVRTLSGRKPGMKETNFQVLKIKLDILRTIAERLTVTTTTAEFVVNEITEKLADPKNGIVAAQALTAMAEATKLEYVVCRSMSYAFEQKSPKVQSETLNWVNSAIREFGMQINPKVLTEDAKKSVQSTNPLIRSAGIALIGTMSMYVGSSIMTMFDNEKPALKQQIQTEFEKNIGQKPPTPTRGLKNSDSTPSVNEDDDSGGADDAQEGTSGSDSLPRIDISSQITESFLAEISDKNWKTRNEGLIKLQVILNEAKLIKSTIGDLPQALAQRLFDSNAKIAQTAMSICEQLATAMGPACKTHVRTLFPGFLQGLGDGKSFIRAAAIRCINIWGEQCGYKEFFEGEMIADALKAGSPALKTEVWGWLSEKLPNIPVKQIPKEELLAMLPYLYANICDRNADVRKNSNEAVLGFMMHLGFEGMVKTLDKQKPSSKKDIQAALDKARPSLPIKPLPKSKQQAPIDEFVKPTKILGGKVQKSQSSAKVADKAASRKKEEEVDNSPLLAVNNAKSQRLLDEQKLKVLKWTFTTPREEFTDLLRDQMTIANVNKGLMANMFHDDFRYHLKVIDSLIEDLPNNSKALICNLDLILKWISLRFYDTNPSVLLKGLEYLNMVFQMLVEKEFSLAENEASSFIPHLLIKIGDPKDTVRNGVRSLLRQICLVYPYGKVFVYIMEGLKSKNARQRTECLDELGFLIETYGLSVCQPTAQVALKEIARHISDRDNSVRSAALNCVVQAYFLVGDRAYKLIGQLSEKEMSMLDERIKRAKKTKKPTPAVEVVKATSSVPETIEIEDPVANDELPPVDDGESTEIVSSSASDSPIMKKFFGVQRHNSAADLRATMKSLGRQATFDQLQPQVLQQKRLGPFGLDPDVTAAIEKDWVRSDQMQSVEPANVDLSFMDTPLKVITRDGVGYPQDKFEKLLAHQHVSSSPTQAGGVYSAYNMSPSQPLLNIYTPRTQSASQQNLADTLLPKLDPHLVKIIQSVGSTDKLTARAAMNELNDIIESPEKQAVLRDYEEMLVQSILVQFKNLSQLPINESLIMYQPLLSITFAFFNSKLLGKNLGISGLKNIMSVLLGLMADQKLASGDHGQYTKVINGICFKILDKSNFTNLNCALIRLLKETCPSAGLPKFSDLIMKCVWRNVKVMPDRSNELDYDAVLAEVHEFMLALPSAWWQHRPSDAPLRTVKTVIHNMAKIKGNSILQHLNKIPSHSELHAYLLKVLKNVQREQNNIGAGVSPQRTVSTKDLSTKRMTIQTHETISQIFKLISDSETSKQGLLRLSEFKAKNPDVDVVSFLKGASPSFQKFIEDGLAEIERQRINENNGDNRCENDNTPLSARTSTQFRTGNKPDADYWLEKLNTLRLKGNINPSRHQEYNNLLDNKVADENLNVNQMAQKISLIRPRDKPELSPNRLEHLQQKLAQIKQQK